MLPQPLPWQPDTAYSIGDEVTDNLGTQKINAGNIQKAIAPGTSSSEPPTWGPNVGDVTPDGSSLIWQNQEEAPFGEFGRFIVDSDSEPGRIFPGPPGNFWPPVLYVPQSVRIHFRAGYSVDGSKVPEAIKTAMKILIANWYENREAAQPGVYTKLPHHVEMLLWTHRFMDEQPTRG